MKWEETSAKLMKCCKETTARFIRAAAEGLEQKLRNDKAGRKQLGLTIKAREGRWSKQSRPMHTGAAGWREGKQGSNRKSQPIRCLSERELRANRESIQDRHAGKLHRRIGQSYPVETIQPWAAGMEWCRTRMLIQSYGAARDRLSWLNMSMRKRAGRSSRQWLRTAQKNLEIRQEKLPLLPDTISLMT